ncbi:protein disulfide isomerase MPD2 [Lachancea thermotolerans CBS 6340]|uniref:KLTH0C10076p n=1 Tax=Lachancea thermotolerans (strain ATCC 56472 / CBS 6340 / NRRL Y-8284) TaxID=559295 RepID=C5DEK8_LACTC|nr:KLTH0C10076p [Lachancea thermotolerans CBS 6340]CAR22219.1 KLTH0C10076p [Lachancea thermotolerans CBS 6340]
MKVSLFLPAFFLPLLALCRVHSVASLDFFYDTINTDSYTVVKYFTTWCSHCKRLGPVFSQLSEAFEDRKDINATFLEVDCDLFGSTLCDHLPGYPAVEVIKPITEQERLDSNSAQKNTEKLSWWSKLIKTIKQGGYNPAWHMDKSRAVEFNGSRDLPRLKNFVDMVVESTEQDKVLEAVLSEATCEDDRCESLRKYLSKVHSTDREAQKLESILRNNPDEELAEIKLKLKLLHKLQEKNSEHDEL